MHQPLPVTDRNLGPLPQHGAHMRNDHGSMAQPSDAPLRAEGPDQVRGISGTRPVTVAPVRPGVYGLGEPLLPGCRTGKWVCSSGVLNGTTLTLSDRSAAVIEQVKARQAQGANTSVQTEPGQPGLSFDSKQGIPAPPLREGTDGAAQARPQQRH